MNEKYIPLYRKYRPQNLSEVVGQEHIKKALTNAVELGKIAHAYLFTGPRGTGKTSTARILAKSLNCEKAPTTSPCGVCQSCLDIQNSIPLDVIEIDAASNRSVEDAQNILDKIQYVPVHGKNKIYIIDEVHMLTTHAFNALLKTLEEPPENVIFILATTEPQKVLDTIKSRCQRFDFKRISTEDIVKHLKNIAELEKIKISEEAILSIAKSSSGGMRDSIALLDQLSVLDNGSEINVGDINNLLGRISFETLEKICEEIINSAPQKAIELLESVYNSGNEPSQILSNLLEYFKNLLITKNCEKETALELTQLNKEQLMSVKKQADELDTHQIVFLIERAAYYIQELRLTSAQHLWLEVAMVDFSNLADNTSLLSLQNRLNALEAGKPNAESTLKFEIKQPEATKSAENKKIEPEKSTKPAFAKAEQHQTTNPSQKIEEQKKPQAEFSPMPKPQKAESSDIASTWISFLGCVKNPAMQALLKLANPVELSPEGVVLTFKQEIFVKQANDSSKKDFLQNAADELFGQKGTKVLVRAPLSTDNTISHNAPVEPQKPKLNQPTPAQEAPEDLQEAEEIEFDEPKPSLKKPEKSEFDQVNMVMDLFDGKYLE